MSRSSASRSSSTTAASPASSSSSAPRVLFVDVSARRGGAETSLDELLAALSVRSPSALAIASARTGDAFPCPVFAIPPVRLHRPSRPVSFLRSLVALLKARRALARILRRFQPDIVHANGIAALFALPGTTARIFWHVRDWPRRPYAALAASRCEAAIAISRPVEEALRHVLPASLRKRIRLVENGIDVRRFAPRDKHRDGCAVGMVAHLVPWKRHDLFVEAAIRLQDFRDADGCPITWVVAGSDLFGEHADYVAALRRTVADAGLSERFVWLDGCDATEILPDLDLLVHPTAEEPFGRVICEAMAAGVPVVACDAGGPGSILTDGETGFLFPRQAENRKVIDERPDTVSALAERIRFALAHPEARAAIAQAAADKVRAHYSADRVADEILSLFSARR